MHNFKYKIKKRPDGRPYIHLPNNFTDDVEHRFMIFEMCGYLLNDLYQRNKSNNQLNPELIDNLELTLDLVLDLSDNLALLISESNDGLNELKDVLKDNDNEENE
jgi:hypothetical protein